MFKYQGKKLNKTTNEVAIRELKATFSEKLGKKNVGS